MPRSLSDITLANLSALLAREMGLLFPRKRWRELEAGVVAAARQLQFPDPDQYALWLISTPLDRQQIETLAAFLTVGETYFFRDPRVLQAIESEILPALIALRRGRDKRLRIWSAGCSTGEEPYTIAILLHRLLPDLADWNLTLLATDINAASLSKAMAGIYGKWSFRATPSWFRTLYFTPAGDDSLRISDEIRRLVSFEYLNLAEDSYPSLPTNTNAMDLILCRNVLMYFSPEMARNVVGKLQRSLVEQGWLILGGAEALPRSFAPLEAVSLGEAVCYQKRSRPLPAAPPEEQGSKPEEPLWLRQEREVPATPQAAEQQEPPHPEEPPPPQEEPPLKRPLLLYRQGLYQQAAERLQELREQGELPREGLFLLIRSLANRGRLQEALLLCQEALAEEKLDPWLHYLRAEILQEQGLGGEAEVSLQRALYLDPKLVLAHYTLGNLTLWSGRPDAACRHFDNALSLLAEIGPEEMVPGSEGMSAGRLREIIASMSDCAGRVRRRTP